MRSYTPRELPSAELARCTLHSSAATRGSGLRSGMGGPAPLPSGYDGFVRCAMSPAVPAPVMRRRGAAYPKCGVLVGRCRHDADGADFRGRCSLAADTTRSGVVGVLSQEFGVFRRDAATDIAASLIAATMSSSLIAAEHEWTVRNGTTSRKVLRRRRAFKAKPKVVLACAGMVD